MSDPSPSGQTWVCRAAKGYTRCDILPCTVRGYPEHKRCGPVPSSDTPSDERACVSCNGTGRTPSPTGMAQIGGMPCAGCFGTGKKENPIVLSNECSDPDPNGGAPCCRPLGHHVLTDHWNGQDEWPAQPAPSSDTPGDERHPGYPHQPGEPLTLDLTVDLARPAPSPVPEASGRPGEMVFTQGSPRPALQVLVSLTDGRPCVDAVSMLAFFRDSAAWNEVAGDPEKVAGLRAAADAMWELHGKAKAHLHDPAPSSSPVPEASGEDEVQPTMHILRRADGEEMGEFAFWATDGPDGWDMAEDNDHDEDTVYEILACYPVARRKILWSTLCETCDGEGDGCPACAGSGECEPPDAEHMPIIARPAPSSSPVGRVLDECSHGITLAQVTERCAECGTVVAQGPAPMMPLDVTALPEWSALVEANERRGDLSALDYLATWPAPDLRIARAARALLAAADRGEPTP